MRCGGSFGVTPILVGLNRVGIVGLGDALKQIDAEGLTEREAIVDRLIETLSPDNYLPESQREAFRIALWREYLRFKGRDLRPFYSEIDVTVRSEPGDERDRFVDLTIQGAVDPLPEEQRIRGHARFVAPTTLEVDGRLRVEARAVVVAAGSRPNVPAPFATLRDHVDVNDDVFEWPDLPESLAVFGLGIIGLELGQALARLGVDTTLFARSERLGPFTDPEVGRVSREVFGAELDLRLQKEALTVIRSDWLPAVDLSFTQLWSRPDPHDFTDSWGDSL